LVRNFAGGHEKLQISSVFFCSSIMIVTFLLCDAMLAQYMPSSSCVRLCVCHTPVLYQNG